MNNGSSDTTVKGKEDSVDFAIYLNKKIKTKGLTANVTKIQKLLYICYGLYLAVYGEQLLNERPKALDYGPVFPNVLKKQKENGDSLDGLKVRNNLKKYDAIIDETLKHFGTWDADKLYRWTHMENTAWDKKIKANKRYETMENDDIMTDFKELLE